MSTSANSIKSKQSVTAEAPGRINLIGEHTDYNEGFVLPASIDRKATVTLRRNGSPSQVNVTAVNLGATFSFNLQQFSPSPENWQNYVMGVVHELQESGAQIEGFDASLEGTVPIGSGMSSSAALECSFAIALNALFEIGLDDWQMIKICQMAEHHFVGIKCGIMDQFASIMGKKDHAMLLDCRDLSFRYIPLILGNYRLVLLNTNVTHSLASSAYNQRRTECEEGLQLLQQLHPGLSNFRELTPAELERYRPVMPDRIFQRCRHVIGENDRVLKAARALKEGNTGKFGDLMYRSHASLQKDYEVSCAELDFLVQQTRNLPFVLGSRMMGGGFGGCTINLVEQSGAATFIEDLAKSYRRQFGMDLTPVEVSTGQGASVLR